MDVSLNAEVTTWCLIKGNNYDQNRKTLSLSQTFIVKCANHRIVDLCALFDYHGAIEKKSCHEI